MFDMKERSTVRIDNVTSRQQNAGPEKVGAASVRFIWRGPNTALRKFGDDLLHALYWHGDTKTIPGVDDIPTKLRSKAIASVAIKGKLEGCTVRFHQATDTEERPTKLVMGSAKVDAFHVEAEDGGSIALSFRVGTDDIEAVAGYLLTHNGQDVEITLEAPELADDKPAPKPKKGKASDPNQGQLDPGTPEGALAASTPVLDGTR